MKYINEKVAVSHESLPGAIKTFIAYMSTVAKVAEIAKYAREPGPRKIGTQKGGKRVQDTMSMTDLNHMSFDQSNCPSCLHRYVLPIGKSLMDIHKHNTAVRKIHTEQMTV